MRNGIYYECDDCGAKAQFSSYNKARKVYGWALDKAYKRCWCPSCAPAHRHGNASNVQSGGRLPTGWVQEKIEGI